MKKDIVGYVFAVFELSAGQRRATETGWFSSEDGYTGMEVRAYIYRFCGRVATNLENILLFGQLWTSD